MKIKRKDLRRIIESFLISENENPFLDAPFQSGSPISSSGKDVEISQQDYIKMQQQSGQVFFKTPEEAFYNGNDFYKSKGMEKRFSIPELCLLWYQKVGKGKDLHMFGAEGKFNNHPDAEQFKKALKDILSSRFATASFNVILPSSNIITNVTTVSPSYWGSSYEYKAPLIPLLLDIVKGKNKDMRDHIMVAIGSMGVGGKEIIFDPQRVDELIIHPSQNQGMIKFKNLYDFGYLFDTTIDAGLANLPNIEKFDADNQTFDLVIEIDGSGIPLNEKAPLAGSGLREDKTGIYKKAKDMKLKIGDKVE